MSVVMLAGHGRSTWMMANALLTGIPLQAIILESPPSRWQALRRRAARLGWRTAAGQVLFSVYARCLGAQSVARAEQIIREHCLEPDRPVGIPIVEVASANDEESIALLRRLKPKVVVVNGTRILARRLLESVDSVFLNLHVGITPAYRGVHGGYWALASQDAANAGVTVHLVNTGIDTGAILYQARIRPTEQDTFATYPLLQLAAGLPLMKQAVADALAGQLHPQPPVLPSKLYSLPTLWQYWSSRLRHGVR